MTERPKFNKIPALNFEREGHISNEQKEILRWLVEVIYTEVSDYINYDHIYHYIPRIPLPLWFEGKRRDICFVYGDKLVFIDVFVKPLSKLDIQILNRYG